MGKLNQILNKVEILNTIGLDNIQINKICFDSRLIEKNDVFVAVKGTNADGHNFIMLAIKNGATAIICEQLPDKLINNITYIQVKNSSEALAYMSSNFYGNPSEKINLIGITGTNGKTTCATLCFELFTMLGYHCGLISTVTNKIGNQDVKATHTTPNPIEINRLLCEMIKEGVSYCFMEVSSHAVVQNRITGLDFKIGAFTNITHDHLDYHGTFKEYIKAKKMFFDNLSKNSIAIYNKDDRNGEVMIQNTKAKTYSFSQKSLSDFKVKILENELSGLVLNLDGNELWSKLIGSFNAYNIITVYAISNLLNQDKLEVLTNLSKLGNVVGRFDYIKSKSDVTAIVDYAHTPDALKNVLSTINDIRTKNEQVISVVGCGGDRDASKRPKMTEIACKLSDKVILTSDNPRSESPIKIIEDMKKGIDPVNLKKTLSIVDRAEAIRTACMLSKTGDIILIAGKGHENYQEKNGEKSYFNDLEQVHNEFKLLNL